MDLFDFEELVADILNIDDSQREDDSYLVEKFEEHFDMDFDSAFTFASVLLARTPIAIAGISGGKYHAFLNKGRSLMLCKLAVKESE